MPDIEISSAQLEALEGLQDALADRHVGAYGTVRPRDALQYLLDYHDADGAGAAPDSTGAPTVHDVEPTDEAADEVGSIDDMAELADDAAEPADETADAPADSADPDDRLEAMMNLMSEHEDKWEVSDSEEGGKYVVELPDGKSMHVRTKDDVRGLLFKHYG